jgi:Subtilase family/Bacterial Ig domain
MKRYLKFFIGGALIAILGGAFLFHFSPPILKGKKGLSDSLSNEAVQVGQIPKSEKDGIADNSSSSSSNLKDSLGEREKSQSQPPLKNYTWISDAQTKGHSNSRGSGSKMKQGTNVLDQGKSISPTLRETVAAEGAIPKILEGKDLSIPAVRSQVVAEMQALEERQRVAVLAKAKELNVPLRIDRPGENVAELYDFRGDEPIYRKTLNVNAAISSGANLLIPAPYNLDGTGIRVGIWDEARVRSTHQELVGRVTVMDSTTSTFDSDHATHVGGVVGATGIVANAKGMAPKVNLNSYDWNSDYTEMTQAGAALATDGLKISLSNHSYGYDATVNEMGVYNSEPRNTDALASSLPYYLIFWAAGNDQGNLLSLGGYQSITYDALSKNVMTVGAVQDAVSGALRSLSNASMTSFSSWGPCDDGRIKPDVVANGWEVYSSSSTGDTSYVSKTGTSQAAPSAMGSAALLQQLYAREFSGQRMRASTLKGLMIHTADDLGNSGPDYKYGWGLINVKAAADVILAHKADLNRPKIIEGVLSRTLSGVKTYTNNYTFIWDGVSPIRATLAWTDPAGSTQTATDSRIPNLSNNLDLKIVSPNGITNLPYVMPFVGTWTQASMSLPAIRGKNNVDNVEQVYLESPIAGTYTVSVVLDGSLSRGVSQVYSLIISGGEGGTVNPSPSVSVTSPLDGASFAKASSVTVSADASDLAYGGGAGLVSKVEFFSGGTKFAEDTTAPYSVSWTPSVSGGYVLTAKATDSEGAVRTSTPINVTILDESRTPVINSLSVLTGKLRIAFQYQVTASDNPSSFTASGLPPGLICSPSGLISGTPTALGFYSSTISARNSLGTGTPLTLNFQISSPTYLEWLASYNLSGVNVDEDSDGDGMRNLMEYFMGLDPKVQNSGSFVSVQGDRNSNFLSLTYRKSKEITGVVGVVEWSTDLATGIWSSDGVRDTLVGDYGNYEERTASVPKALGEVRKFLILRVTQP